MKTYLLPVLALAAMVSACEGSSLTEEDVTDLPPGNATGSELSGTYAIELYTTGCAGKCAVDYQGILVTYCDVGDREDAQLIATQTDGALQADVDQGDILVSRLEGGVNTDGTFTIGGYATHLGGSGEVAVLSEGTISQTGEFYGTAEAHLWGDYDGASINCESKHELIGARVQ